MMRVDDVLRDREDGIIAHAHPLLRLENHFSSEHWMFLHLRTLFFRERAGLVEDVIGNADLADIVERRETGQEIDPLRRQVVAKIRMPGKLRRETPRVL